MLFTPLLNYCTTNTDTVLQYLSSKMYLHVHSNAYYLPKSQAKQSCTWGNHFLSNKKPTSHPPSPNSQPSPPNSAVHAHCSIIPTILPSATKTKTGANLSHCLTRSCHSQYTKRLQQIARLHSDLDRQPWRCQYFAWHSQTKLLQSNGYGFLLGQRLFTSRTVHHSLVLSEALTITAIISQNNTRLDITGWIPTPAYNPSHCNIRGSNITNVRTKLPNPLSKGALMMSPWCHHSIQVNLPMQITWYPCIALWHGRVCLPKHPNNYL